MKNFLLNFINRVLHPTLHLKTEEEINLFLDSDKEFVENTEFFKNKYEEFGDSFNNMPKHTRVIAFFHDKNEYKNEFKLFTIAA